MLAVFTVNSTLDSIDANSGDGVAADSLGKTTLRAAIMEANALLGADTINVPSGTYKLTLEGRFEDFALTGDLDITESLTINGAGSELTIIDADSLDRVFETHTSFVSPTFEFRGMTIQNGNATVGGAYENVGGGASLDFFSTVTLTDTIWKNNSAVGYIGLGGAIYSAAKLTIVDSTFDNNTAELIGGAIYVGTSGATTTILNSLFTKNTSGQNGGAIGNSFPMTIENSTLDFNRVVNGSGGAISNSNDVLTLINTTLTANQAASGGAIESDLPGTVQVKNSTITKNIATIAGGGFLEYLGPGLTFENSIIANNTAPTAPDISANVISKGNNLIGNTSGNTGFGTTDLLNVDPLLGPLASNGGPTQTHALLPGSPAIDAAKTSSSPATDQRGVLRPQGTAADIGAFELEYFLVVSIIGNVISEHNSGAIGVVSRSSNDTALALTVTLKSNDLTEANVPSSVTIPANEVSVSFPITAVDDTLLDGTQIVEISASAPAYSTGSATLTVLDYETFDVSFNPTSIAENGSPTNLTITRSNTDVALPLTVEFDNSDSSEVSVPLSWIIPGGSATVTLPVYSVDDDLLDGTQTAVIKVGAQGYIPASANLSITDVEFLQVGTLLSMTENSQTQIGSVGRSNSDISQPLVVTLTSSDETEATVPATVTIPANQKTVDFVITSVDDDISDGRQPVTITPSAPGYFSGTKAFDVVDDEVLRVSIDKIAISEKNGAAIGTVSRGTSTTTMPITISLSSSDTTEATVPATITIPANANSITFPITSVDDDLLDGSQSVTITASSTIFASGSANIQIDDFEQLTVEATPNSISEKGGVATGRVIRTNTDISLPVTVLLSSNDTTEATVPTSVTILANQASASFSIAAVDDNLFDGTQTITIAATAAAYVSGLGSIDITDFETLTVTFNSPSINEKSGSTIATVTRNNSDITQPITVTLSSSDTTEATVPSTVVIPANQASMTFPISSADDSLLDGTQTVVISASSLGYENGSKSLDVTDNEQLLISIDRSSMSESGGTAVGTVTRPNTDIGLPLQVTLLSSDTSEASVPTTVIIPANQASVEFPINAVDDRLLDGIQTVSVTVSAIGYFGNSKSIDVTDAEFLQLEFNIGAIAELAGTATGRVTRSNTDIALPLTVTLSNGDPSVLSMPTSVIIPAGQPSADFAITAVDDTILDGTQTVQLTAAATEYFNGTKSIDVTDVESLTVSINLAAISENLETATGTVTRGNSDLGLPFTVTLTSLDLTELSVPATLTIPANQASTTFTITSVDDALIDGTQKVAVLVSGTGYYGNAAFIDVMDYETAVVTFTQPSIIENGGQTLATVTRSNTDISSQLTVLLNSGDTTEATVPPQVIIPAGQTSTTFTVKAVDDSLHDGDQSVSIMATASGYVATSSTIVVTDSESLTLVLTQSAISENGGLTTARVTRNNTDLNQPLIVNLVSGNTSEAAVSTSVTIPANQASATFTITAVDDTLLDGPQSLSIVASAPGYIDASQSLTVSDFEFLTVTINPASISESAGTATGTVTRSNTDISLPITVILSSNDLTEATVTTTVVIPANQSSVDFSITSVDDSLLDGSQLITTTATSAGYNNGTRTLTVTDAEQLSISIASTSISEKGGTAVGVVTRDNTDISASLTVSLASSDTSEATVPSSIIIPANQSSAQFTITTVDDTLLDGSQAVTITASAAGYFNGNRNLDVNDAESLTVSIAPTAISENGGTATGTVTRSNTDITQQLTVRLTSSDTSEVNVPTTVTIPSNQASVTFTILAVDDAILDGKQSAIITATADGYADGTQAIDVTDAESLVVSIDAASISEFGGTATGTVTRGNTDISLPLTVTLLSDDITEATVPISVTIPANQASSAFVITAVDDSLLDGTQSVVISVSSLGYDTGSTLLSVSDAESLALTIDLQSISEKGGSAKATVSRSNTDIASPLTVTLLSSDETEASVATSVIIPANSSSVIFPIDALDDALLDGQQIVSIQVSAANYASATKSLQVSDSESISFTINVSSISEKNGLAIGTVSRSNTDTNLALVVQLTSDDTTEATVPASVTIPANQSQVTFSITSVNDSLVDGSQTVHLTASASDYENGTASVIVVDDDPNFPWKNPRNRFDVNDDGSVSPIDALLVINALNTRLVLTPELPNPFLPVRYVDVSGDGLLSPIDALLVINELNRVRSRPEGEQADTAQLANRKSDQFDALIDLLTEDQLRNRKRNRIGN